jgi:hypothetical protein
MSASGEPAIIIKPQADEPGAAAYLSAAALIVLAVAAISYLAVRYLNWAMAPRRFWTRVLFAGTLPTGILIGLLIALELSRGANVVGAVANLSRIPSEGRLMIAGMLAFGIGVAWLVARRRDRREARRANAVIEAFE